MALGSTHCRSGTYCFMQYRATPGSDDRCPKNVVRIESLHQRQIQVAYGLVDFLRALEANRRAVHPCILEGKPHRLFAVVVTMVELTATAQFHADHTQPFLL